MLFISKSGELIEVNRTDYVNDVDYYQSILRIKGVVFKTENFNPDERVKAALQSISIAQSARGNKK
tara:strand:+ start:993 stop:1190 length:198 start_codon:yes stop_codon:yes gene_type:complete